MITHESFVHDLKQGTLIEGESTVRLISSLKVHLQRRCGPAIWLSDAISIENFLSPRHRFEMDIPFEIYAPRN